jgi:Xaa-Pro dipeptidase
MGTASAQAGSPIDFPRLRAERRRRVFEGMADAAIDVLVLGRPANVRYASGATQLWTAGSRPFGPACVVVGATGRVHLLSTWDAGVPPEIARQDLFGLSWNPSVLTSRLQAIPGLDTARMVATDGFTPGMGQLLRVLCPQAAFVDAAPVLVRARSSKTPDELACIRVATSIAEAALSALVGALHPGVTERQLLGVYAAAIAALGAPTPPTEAVVCATPRQGDVQRRRFAAGRAVVQGELVVLSPGAFYAGYESSLARTWIAGDGPPTGAQRQLARRARETVDTVTAVCVAGASGADVQQAWDGTGAPPPVAPFVRGVGLGAEGPVIGGGFGARAELAAGMVLSVEAWVVAEGAGGVLEQDLVLVTEGEPEVLTRYGRGPLG